MKTPRDFAGSIYSAGNRNMAGGGSIESGGPGMAAGEGMKSMQYKSTRDSGVRLNAADVITNGISKEGGLYVPEGLPALTASDIERLAGLSYVERAKFVLSKFLTDFTEEELAHCVENAYTDKKFDSGKIAELAHLYDGTYMLELWHGPTCAFKDMALQLLPYLLTTSAKKVAADKEIVILVATSGDTGKAALEGFRDVDRTRIIVFYPEDGVSKVQKRQMTTQEGKNVCVAAIKGNFDDAQTGVKRIFGDAQIADKLAGANMMFSSANSINWGRLVPQIVYYISTYCELLANGEIKNGEPVNIVVPTGNFGNILAAYYAKKMGLPVGKLICASNANNVLTDFIRTGVYDRNRAFHTTISPSMDILISSNLERLLYDMVDGDDAVIREWFGSLAREGRYEVSADVKARLADEFYAGCCDDAQTMATIKQLFDRYSYLCDSHTAVAVKVYEDYVAETGDRTKTVIASTASPFKFAGSVLEAVTGKRSEADEFDQVKLLGELSGLAVPEQLAALRDKEIRFTGSVAADEMADTVLKSLGIQAGK